MCDLIKNLSKYYKRIEIENIHIMEIRRRIWK